MSKWIGVFHPRTALIWVFGPEPLALSFAAHMEKKTGTPAEKIEPVDKIELDMPGMIAVDRKWVGFEFDGVEIEFPATDFEALHAQLRSSLEKKFSDGSEYVELVGYIRAIIVDPGQRKGLLAAIESKLEEAKEIARGESVEFERRLAEMNKSPYLAIGKEAMLEKGLLRKEIMSGIPTGDKN